MTVFGVSAFKRYDNILTLHRFAIIAAANFSAAREPGPLQKNVTHFLFRLKKAD